MSKISCPKCKSANVRETNNLHQDWACGTCGFRGDAAEFDEETRSMADTVGEFVNAVDFLRQSREEGIECQCKECGREFVLDHDHALSALCDAFLKENRPTVDVIGAVLSVDTCPECSGGTLPAVKRAKWDAIYGWITAAIGLGIARDRVLRTVTDRGRTQKWAISAYDDVMDDLNDSGYGPLL